MDYWNFRDEVSVENGLLFKGYKLIVPKNLRRKVLQLVHKGHFGIEKMRHRARDMVFWPGINKDIIEIAQICEVCQTFARSQQKETLMSHDIPQGPWEKLGIDFSESQSYQYL